MNEFFKEGKEDGGSILGLMRKKGGGWFTAIKRVFSQDAKESERRVAKKDKRTGSVKARNGEVGSYMPFYREPSSVEKILGDAERAHGMFFETDEHLGTPPWEHSMRGLSSFKAVASPRQLASVLVMETVSPGIIARRKDAGNRRELTFHDHRVAATAIQAAYRGYVARRKLRALDGLARLQEVVRGQNVKQQAANALKYLQLLVRVQYQIQSRRIQMLENHVRHLDYDRTLSEWSQVSDEGNQDEWDDSFLTKEETEARLRDRTVSARFPRLLPSTHPVEAQPQKSFQITPPREIHKPRPWTPSSDFHSSKSSASKHSRSRANASRSPNNDLSLKDDDSLTSCPPFSVPNYMSPTVSAKAKVRSGSNPMERLPRAMTTEGKKLFSFALFSGKNSSSLGVL